MQHKLSGKLEIMSGKRKVSKKGDADEAGLSKEQDAVARFVRFNCPTSTTMFQGNEVQYFNGEILAYISFLLYLIQFWYELWLFFKVLKLLILLWTQNTAPRRSLMLRCCFLLGDGNKSPKNDKKKRKDEDAGHHCRLPLSFMANVAPSRSVLFVTSWNWSIWFYCCCCYSIVVSLNHFNHGIHMNIVQEEIRKEIRRREERAKRTKTVVKKHLILYIIKYSVKVRKVSKKKVANDCIFNVFLFHSIFSSGHLHYPYLIHSIYKSFRVGLVARCQTCIANAFVKS
uniref:Transmembrane protein n=1 Tax=Heterorhabditis bacteriophora TaxID=37862 RepID=A0A1I7WBR7_HETBA